MSFSDHHEFLHNGMLKSKELLTKPLTVRGMYNGMVSLSKEQDPICSALANLLPSDVPDNYSSHTGVQLGMPNDLVFSSMRERKKEVVTGREAEGVHPTRPENHSSHC